MRSNKGRAGLTILGVAVGVFVGVALSSDVAGINEAFRRDVAAAGPNSFFVYRRPIEEFECAMEDRCPGRRNPPILETEAQQIGRHPSILAVTIHTRTGGVLRYHNRQSWAGIDIYT